MTEKEVLLGLANKLESLRESAKLSPFMEAVSYDTNPATITQEDISQIFNDSCRMAEVRYHMGLLITFIKTWVDFSYSAESTK